MSVSHFLAGGQEEAWRALREEYATKVSELQAHLTRTRDPAETERIRSEIEALEAELREKEKGLRWASFGAV